MVRKRMAAMLAGFLALTLAGCGIGAPQPPVSPRAWEPRTVLLVGDSLLWQSAPYLRNALAWHGIDATIVDHSIGGTGVLDYEFRERVGAWLDEVPAGSAVVFAFSGNCFFGAGFQCPATPGSPEFYALWEQGMRDVIADARQRELVPLWAKAPPIACTCDVGHAPVVRELALMVERVTIELGLVMPDWWQALSDAAGTPQQVLWYEEVFTPPAWHWVREDDGLHFTPDGARRAANWTAAVIAKALLPIDEG